MGSKKSIKLWTEGEWKRKSCSIPILKREVAYSYKFQNNLESNFTLMMIWPIMTDLTLCYNLIQHETSKFLFQILKFIWGNIFQWDKKAID